MGSLDTRLHRLEAMVAGLLAWQNLAERQLQRQQKRLDDIAGAIGSILHCCTELEARVAALKQAAAPAQAAHDHDWVLFARHGADLEFSCECGAHKLEQAAQPAPCTAYQPGRVFCQGGPSHCAGQWAGGHSACYQPAPQQPRSCIDCQHGEHRAREEPCVGCKHNPTLHDCWQPRGGGG